MIQSPEIFDIKSKHSETGTRSCKLYYYRPLYNMPKPCIISGHIFYFYSVGSYISLNL